MAHFRKRGSSWYAEVQKAGQRVGKSFATKAEARAWALEQEEVITSGIDSRHTLADALTEYSEKVSITKKGKRWEQVRLDRFKRTMDFADYRLCDITTPMLAAWRDSRLKEVSAASVLRELNLLSSVFVIARREWRWITTDPLKDVKRPTSPAPRRRGISQAEIDRVCLALGYEDGAPITTLSQQVAVALLLAIETAMRQGEILGLTADRVNLEQRYVQLEKTKNGDARQVPLSTKAVALLKSLPGLFTVSSASADTLFRKARLASGCTGLHFHDSRSEALTRLSQKLDVLELARMVGHRDLKSLLIYYNKSATELAKRLD